jgi:hypothetical protein
MGVARFVASGAKRSKSLYLLAVQKIIQVHFASPQPCIGSHLKRSHGGRPATRDLDQRGLSSPARGSLHEANP